MLANVSKLFGAVLLLVGVLGFIPAVTPDGHLLGIFHVNAVHNVIHVLSGVAALAAGFSGASYARLYFQVFGVIYGLVTVLGFVYGDNDILGLVASNMADTILHIVIAGSALVLGFGKFGANDARATS